MRLFIYSIIAILALPIGLILGTATGFILFLALWIDVVWKKIIEGSL